MPNSFQYLKQFIYQLKQTAALAKIHQQSVLGTGTYTTVQFMVSQYASSLVYLGLCDQYQCKLLVRNNKQVGELSHTNRAAGCVSLGQNIKWKTTFYTKRCWCHKTRSIYLFYMLFILPHGCIVNASACMLNLLIFDFQHWVTAFSMWTEFHFVNANGSRKNK